MVRVSPRLASHSGVTIVELLVVVIVIAILAAIALPMVFNQVRVNSLDSSVLVIGSKVKEARMEALKRNKNALIRLDSATRTAQIRSTNAAGTQIDVGSPLMFANGVGIGSSVNITFDSMGRPVPAASTTVTFTQSGGKRKDMIVSANGTVSFSGVY